MKAASGGSAAAGCLRSAALRGRAACQTSPCFLLRIRADAASHANATHVHTQVHNQAGAGMRRSTPLHVKTRMQVQKPRLQTAAALAALPFITQVILALPGNIYLITLHYQ